MTVARGLKHGFTADAEEILSLQRLLKFGNVSEKPSMDHDLYSLRQELVQRLRSGALALDTPGLLQHLMRDTAWRVTIDQPKYPSLLAIKSTL